jgi:predicted nucleic acid-binding protein
LKAYADTSFLVSLYTFDANSATAAAHMRKAPDTLLVTPFGELELTNAIELRVFRRELTAARAKTALAAFESDMRGSVLTAAPLPAAVYQKARQLSRHHTAGIGARTLDMMHVAAALVLEASALYTFDRRQRDLAKAEGLSTPVRLH